MHPTQRCIIIRIIFCNFAFFFLPDGARGRDLTAQTPQEDRKQPPAPEKIKKNQCTLILLYIKSISNDFWEFVAPRSHSRPPPTTPCSTAAHTTSTLSQPHLTTTSRTSGGGVALALGDADDDTAHNGTDKSLLTHEPPRHAPLPPPPPLAPAPTRAPMDSLV